MSDLYRLTKVKGLPGTSNSQVLGLFVRESSAKRIFELAKDKIGEYSLHLEHKNNKDWVTKETWVNYGK